MASIETRNGKFTVRWRTLDGEPKRRTCTTAKTARELKLDVETALSLGRDWEPATTSSEPRITEIAAAYLGERSLFGSSGGYLREIGTNLDLFVRFARTLNKDPRASVFSRTALFDFAEWLGKPETRLRKNSPRSQRTVNKIIGYAERLWEWAEASDRWPNLIPRPRRVDLPSLPEQRVIAPTWAEVDACVDAQRGWQRKLALWLRYTGLRAGESMKLLWSDVDMEGGTLDIRPEIDKRRVGRTIPLSPHLLDELATWGKREGWLIPTTRKPGPAQRAYRSRDMVRAWKRAGVREAVWKKRPDHAFRRAWKTGLLGLRATPDAIDFLQGHALGAASSRGRYIDGSQLPLRETVAMVPKIMCPESAQAAPLKLVSRR